MLTASQLDLLRNLILRRTGIFYPKKKDYLLGARVLSMTKANGLSSEAELLAALKNDAGNLWQQFVKNFTTNHTFFNRESEHFGIMVEHIRQGGISSPAIWVAASSTGEEVYTIAMYLEEVGNLDYHILGSDINQGNLRAMKAGTYPGSKLHGLSPQRLRRFFTTQGNQDDVHYSIIPSLKKRIFAKTLNLTEYIRFTQDFDIIFCRNVLMYFKPDTQKRVIRTLLDNLAPGGLLFIGQSENLGGLGLDSHLINRGMSVFEKRMRNG